jgi:hypothetical protein
MKETVKKYFLNALEVVGMNPLRSIAVGVGLLLLVLVLAGCGDKEVSFQTVEEQRAQGRANAMQVAAEYQKTNPRIAGWEAIVKADTTHSTKCPQGDGWAEVVFMRTERVEGSTKNLDVQKATLMCSTVSANQGCVMVTPVDNWTKHVGKSMDGTCAATNQVPMPLPKVVGAR